MPKFNKDTASYEEKQNILSCIFHIYNTFYKRMRKVFNTRVDLQKKNPRFYFH